MIHATSLRRAVLLPHDHDIAITVSSTISVSDYARSVPPAFPATTTYAHHRRPDPRIARAITAALGDATSVVNVGAGAGSYEPADRRVVAVEPSRTMLRQRPPGSAPVVRAVAETLPFPAAAFDAALAILTIHHWSDWRAGLRELTRVARDRIVLFTWDPASDGGWLGTDYFPDILAADRARFPALDALRAALAPRAVDVVPVPIPHDCSDGFMAAYWRRPEAYLDPAIRQAISSLARDDAGVVGLAQLAVDLKSGAWRRHHGHLLAHDELDFGYRLVVAH